MPDWSYHPLKKIILSKVEAQKSRQFIHHSMRIVASLPGGKYVIEFLGHNGTSPLLQKSINNINFKSPIGLSGLINPQLTGMTAFQELGFGYLEIGPIVFRQPTIQIPPRWQQKHISFSNKSEKVTLKKALQFVITKNIHVPLFARVDESLCTLDLRRCIEQLSPFVDGFFLYTKQLKQLDSETEIPIYQIVSADCVNNSVQFVEKINGIVIDVPYANIEDRSL